MSHVSTLLQDHQEQWEEALSLVKSKEADNTPPSPCTSCSRIWVNKSVHLTAEDTDVMVLCLACATRSIPPFQKCGTKEPDKIPGYHHTEPYTGSSVCDSLIVCILTGLIPSVHSLAGKMTTRKQVKMGQDIPRMLSRTWALMGSDPELFKNYRNHHATCTPPTQQLR
ncbi:hypothetical protein GWK47_043033 [Chionoecetes opilio]|uniref:Uncharacterized protein n=1 Tax=Chionoecetes opilio TaxID=41210 RepID=A0A8J4YHD5_CHIOP|nr:hypothetical protein GWK47_043033 [Chionoecetes opilio]